jgi:hypothetical protein
MSPFTLAPGTEVIISLKIAIFGVQVISMTFKVSSVKAFTDGLGVICLENCISMPSNIVHKSVGRYITVKLDDVFISRLNKVNPLAMDKLYKLG